jgi:hypothetical protein
MDNEEIFSELVSMLTYECPQLPSPVAERALISTMRTLAQKTGVLQHQLTVTGLADCVSTYDFTDQLPEGFEPIEWQIVWWCECKLKHIDKCDPCPHGYEFVNKTCIKLYPTPNCPDDGDLEICMSLKPKFNMCFIPSELIDDEEALIAGAKSILLMQSKKPWSDLRASRIYKREFKAACNALRTRVCRDYNGDDNRMEHRFV